MIFIRNILFGIILLISADYSAQSIIQLFVEDFNNNPNTFITNSGSVGADIGDNKWIINNEYMPKLFKRTVSFKNFYSHYSTGRNNLRTKIRNIVK